MERNILTTKLKDKIPCRDIRDNAGIEDVVTFATKQLLLKVVWGHVATFDYNTWPKRITDCQLRNGKTSRGRQGKRRGDDSTGSQETREHHEED
ncbi:endonuclease-reverse transcriptase [Elysia marginata]|uniref:Endonuclease-reverse transcriptase n=1 Tax=Elysia marginata TaxID=1093978 RepID=A0AAV4IXH3_9GAST|nr:endonuclease-reverse transcriptase [Elysia marginata]